MINKINAKVQKRFKIGAPNFLNVPKHQNFGKLKAKFNKQVDKLRNAYGLKDNDTVSLYHEMYWREFVYNAAFTLEAKGGIKGDFAYSYQDEVRDLNILPNSSKQSHIRLKWLLSSCADFTQSS